VHAEGIVVQVGAFPNIDIRYLTQDICRRLADVVVQLEPLSEQNGLLRFLRNGDHAASLSGFVQNIAYAITDYQVCGRKFLHKGISDNPSDIYSTRHI
jgi:hypothetical protein